MERFRIEVGHDHQVKPGNIVGAIANEADIESKYIGRISIYDDHSTVDLPEGMPKELLYTLKKVWVSGQQLKISSLSKGAGSSKSTGKKTGDHISAGGAKERSQAKGRSRDSARGDDKSKRKLSLKKKARKI
jgi:ATP-dependent RNA helicase DeaD